MKISELVAALTAELIRGNDAEIGFTVPLTLKHAIDNNSLMVQWGVCGYTFYVPIEDHHRSRAGVDYKPNNAEFRHREDGVMEIVLT